MDSLITVLDRLAFKDNEEVVKNTPSLWKLAEDFKKNEVNSNQIDISKLTDFMTA